MFALKQSVSQISRAASHVGVQRPLAAMFSDKTRGTVKYFNSKKGFGFIIDNNDSSREFFVHQTEIHKSGFRSLAQGEEVEFELETDSYDRTRAKNVTAPGGGEVQGEQFRRANTDRYENNRYDGY